MKLSKAIQLAVSMTMATASAAKHQSTPHFAEKGGMLRAFNQAAAKHNDIQCDHGQIPCLSESSHEVLSCVEKGEDCSCPEGLTQCGGLFGFTKYCRELCCEEGQEVCSNDAMKVLSCGDPEDGGCTCPDPMTKEEIQPIGMYCTCKGENLKQCYGAKVDGAETCALIDESTEGKCACPEGKVECIHDAGDEGEPARSVCLDDCDCAPPKKICADSEGNIICGTSGEECAYNKGFFDMQKTRKDVLLQGKEMIE